MITVVRVSGLRIVIYLDDHEPAHVHVYGDGEAKINLDGADGCPHLVWADGMTRAQVRRAMALVTEHREALRRRWSSIHG